MALFGVFAVSGQAQTRSPYGGSNWSVSDGAVIQAENYDNGGEGVAYHDTTSGNSGGQYRSDNVDIESCTDTGGGYDVGWISDGEWLDYTVNTTAATYNIVIRGASNDSVGGSVNVLLDGVSVGTVSIPFTGGWQTWQDFTISNVAIAAGTGRTLQLQFSTGNFNVNYVKFTAVAPARSPYGGSNWAINNGAVIQAENYDLGGEGVAYHDTTSGNSGGAYRTDNVDIEACSDTGGGYNVGWIADGEWLDYTVNSTAGTYNIVIRGASNNNPNGGSVKVLLDGTVLGTVAIPYTGGWQTWQDFTISNVAIAAGTGRTLQLQFVGGGFNVNSVRFASVGSTRSPYGGSPASISNGSIIQVENYDLGGEGVAYHDTDTTNNGGQYRTDGVDIEACSDTGGGYDVGWTADGEWLDYTVNSTGGTYNIVIRGASNNNPNGGSINVLLDGTVVGSVAIPYTGGWQTWQDFTISNVSIASGSNRTLQLQLVGGGYNLNYVRFASASTGTLTQGQMAQPNGRYFTGYYPSWGDNWFSAAGLTDDQIYSQSNFAHIPPGVCTHVMIAFAQPDFTWSGISANTWSGTGISFSAAPQDIKESIRILHELNRKVILSVGGATYGNWGTLASEAGNSNGATKNALKQIMLDLNLDGLDVDYELSGVDSASLSEYANAIQACAEAVNAAGGGRILMTAAWSTGADYTAATTGDPGYPGTVSYWGGNAGRERQVYKYTVSSGPFAGRTIGSLYNVVNAMTYDAGYQNFDPVTAWNEYRALLPSSVVVGIGLEIPTESWGGATLVLNNSDAGAAGTVVTQDQYGNTPRGPYSVQRFVGTVMSNGTNANSHDGGMMWELTKTSSPTNANATSVPSYIANMYGYVGVAP